MRHKLYNILEVSNNASPEEIKKSYKKLAFKWHPDKNKDNAQEAELKFKEISNAYTILSDENERRKYDQLGDDNYNNSGGEQEINPMDIFEKFFGRGMGHPFANHDFGGHNFRHHFAFNDFSENFHTSQTKKCKSVRHEYNMTLEEAYKGVNKNMKITVKKYCPNCVKKCDNCQGRGIVNQVRSMGIFTQMSTGPCGICGGTGYKVISNKDCDICNGNGTYEKEQSAHLSIPPGVSNSFKTVFPELGEQPMHENQIPGDLILEIKIADHKNFIRKNNDLWYKHDISLIDSITGKDIYIEYFDEIITLNTFKEFNIISPLKQYMIKDKGMPFMDSNTKKGNMIIEFNVIYPTINDSSKLSELRTKLEEVIC